MEFSWILKYKLQVSYFLDLALFMDNSYTNSLIFFSIKNWLNYIFINDCIDCFIFAWSIPWNNVFNKIFVFIEINITWLCLVWLPSNLLNREGFLLCVYSTMHAYQVVDFSIMVINIKQLKLCMSSWFKWAISKLIKHVEHIWKTSYGL